MSAEEKNVQPTHLAAALQLWICISAAPAALPLPNSSQRSSLLGKFSQDSCFLFSSFCLEFSLGDLGLLCSHGKIPRHFPWAPSSPKTNGETGHCLGSELIIGPTSWSSTQEQHNPRPVSGKFSRNLNLPLLFKGKQMIWQGTNQDLSWLIHPRNSQLVTLLDLITDSLPRSTF